MLRSIKVPPCPHIIINHHQPPLGDTLVLSFLSFNRSIPGQWCKMGRWGGARPCRWAMGAGPRLPRSPHGVLASGALTGVIVECDKYAKEGVISRPQASHTPALLCTRPKRLFSFFLPFIPSLPSRACWLQGPPLAPRVVFLSNAVSIICQLRLCVHVVL